MEMKYMEKRKIKVDDLELRVMVKALTELSNKRIADSKPAEDIGALLFCLQSLLWICS